MKLEGCNKFLELIKEQKIDNYLKLLQYVFRKDHIVFKNFINLLQELTSSYIKDKLLQIKTFQVIKGMQQIF